MFMIVKVLLRKVRLNLQEVRHELGKLLSQKAVISCWEELYGLTNPGPTWEISQHFKSALTQFAKRVCLYNNKVNDAMDNSQSQYRSRFNYLITFCSYFSNDRPLEIGVIATAL